jgi:hypothetical protein
MGAPWKSLKTTTTQFLCKTLTTLTPCRTDVGQIARLGGTD